MARTELSSAQIRDATIARVDLNTQTPGAAVIAKIVAGAGISISQTGADSGTGDVTVSAASGVITPAAHATTHNTGGSDPLTALSAAILTTGNLPFARVQLSATARLLGRGSAGAGAMEEVTLGTGLSMAGTVLNVGALAPAAHASTHYFGANDPVNIQQLAGYPGIATQFLNGQGGWAVPPGDEVFIGTADPGAAYELWYDTDEPGIDPTVLPHHVSHETGGADEIVNISATRITSGVLPDARLSTNVPLKNAANVFTKNFGVGAHPISIQAVLPLLSLVETAAPANQKMWRVYASGQTLVIGACSDDEATIQNQIAMDRVGTVTLPRTVNLKGANPFLALTDMNQAVDARAFILQNAGGFFTVNAYNDAFTTLQSQPLMIDRTGNMRVCPVQTSSRLQFGGGTAAYPAIRWSGAGPSLEIVAADNSVYAGLKCSTIDASGSITTSGGVTLQQTLILNDGVNPYVIIQNNAGYLRWITQNYGQVMYMDMAGNFTTVASLITGGYGQFNTGIYERTRAAKLGDWTAFTPVITSPGGFTVGANYGSWQTHGGTCIYRFSIENGTLLSPSGVGSFYISLPFNQIGAGLVGECFVRFYLGWVGTSEVGFGEVAPGDPSRILVYRGNGGAFPAGAGNAFYCRGFIVYQIA